MHVLKLSTSFLLLIGLILYTSSCSEFCEGECIGEDPTFYFNILSATDSTNLVFGDQKLYDIESLKAFRVDVTDTTFFNVETYDPAVSEFPALRFDHVDFTATVIFLEFNESDIDTLSLRFQTSKGDCCYPITRLNTVDQNGVEIYNRQNNQIFVNVLK